MTDYTKLQKQADIRQTVKNALCIDGFLNGALDSIIASDSPDGMFCTLTTLSHKAVDMSFDALLSHISELERRVAEQATLLTEAREVLSNNWFRSNDGEDYNNEDVIDMDRKIADYLLPINPITGDRE